MRLALEPGSLVTISFPFTDLTAVKRRPALILIVQGEDLVVCGVTSKISRHRDAIPLDDRGMAEGRLPARSEVRPLKLFTIHRALVHTRVGRVSATTFRRVVAILISSLRRGSRTLT
ncbi:MAG: type II toxin-antitoxin system PemK/MazF family toxin [Methanobacteriota archaeon]|nr:MAG: type II toxin-antitoxin system PemK/MazF family toxin [Euryarchaeota archaeon]TLZ98764.1 MAG: type II toxin-antitoxin system PemK/MazF family toxin [Euryarchaeota archaeon]TMA01636.1 MAG: type II toxin-antitoxin system PemK/MazF family toxin [Euryarchaeota archaeon]